MKMVSTTYGKTKPRSFKAKSILHKRTLTEDSIMIPVPMSIVREYTKGLDRTAKNLKCFEQDRPMIEVKYGGLKHEAGYSYQVDMQPVQYNDNSGAYSWTSKCTVTALNGGLQPSNPVSCTLGTGFYSHTNKGTEKVGGESSTPYILIGSLLAVLAIYLIAL